MRTSAETGYGKADVLQKIKSVIDFVNQPKPVIEEDLDEEVDEN